MYQSIILPLLIIVFLGSIGIFTITKKRPEQANQLWTKYFVYLFLLFLNITLIVWNISIYYIFMGVFWTIGLYEILTVVKNKKKLLFSSLFVYFICGFLFFSFITSSNNTILFFYITVLTLDAFSQIFGQLFGKNKITKISPAKTYEGLLGGLFMCVVVGFFIVPLIDPIETLPLIITSLTIGIVGFVGDLLASFLKRSTGVKDFSKLLPGQGGVLDRYDSWFVSGIAYFILQNVL